MEISLFRYLDILIAFAMVMLIASSMVTVLAQWIMNLRKDRVTILSWGLENLLKQLDPGVAKHAKAIAEKVLLHPQVADVGAFGKERAGSVIRREEFIQILLEFAKPDSGLDGPARDALLAAIKVDRNDTPDEMLDKIRMRAMQLEAQFPNAAAYLWRGEAIVGEAGGKFVAGVMSRFDLMSDRLTQVFAQKARLVSVVLSIAVAALLPLDSLALLKQLSTDEKLRSSLVMQAQQLEEKTKPAQGTGDIQKDLKTLQELKSQLERPGLSVLPAGWWYEKATSVKNGAAEAKFDAMALLTSIVGVLLSAALMSFGAPFWFDMVKSLVKLRPAGATTEDKDRQDRAAQQPAPRGPGATPPAEGRDSEAGMFIGTEVAPAPGASG